MKLFGIAHHAPIYVRSLIAGAYKLRGKEQKKTWVLPVGGSVKKKSALESGAILILRYADLIQNLEALNSRKFRDKPVFVFCSVVRLQDLIGVQVLDNDRIQDCTFRLSGLSKHDLAHYLFDVKDTHGMVQKKGLEFLPQLVKDLIQGSLLNPLLTILYQLPLAQQSAARSKIFEWMASDQPVKALLTGLVSIGKLGGASMPEAVISNLVNTLDSPLGKEYRAAVEWVFARRASKKPVPYKQLIRKFKVTAFEIKYIVSILVKNKKNADILGKTVEEVFYSRPRNHHIKRKITQHAAKLETKRRKGHRK